MSLGLLARQPLTWDSEAAAYILQVEAADGQSLELGVARAINTFVIDCKVRGIWGAIKSCCLLSGARTLNGALRPLKGVAPTNNNFINSDYNRETGLKGNGVDKFLNSNRLASADPNNNAHISIYVSQPPVISGLSQYFYLGSSGNLSGSRCISVDNSASVNRLKISSNKNISFIYNGSANGFIGASSLGDVHSTRFNSLSSSITTTLEPTHPNNYVIHIFGDNAFGANFRSSSRLSFYSIGESLDLRLLNQCYDNFIVRLKQFFYPESLHSDVLLWLNRINQKIGTNNIPSSILSSLNSFCSSIYESNLRSKLYRLNLFLGNDLSYCNIPFYIGPDNNIIYGSIYDDLYNFTDTSYNIALGLRANGSSTRIETNFPTSLLMSMFPSTHLSYYCTSLPTNTNSFFKTVLSTQSGWGLGSTGGATNRIGSSAVTGVPYALGSRIISRTSESSLCLYDNGLLKSCQTSVNTAPNYNYATIRIMSSRIENNAPSEFIDGAFGTYSIGLGLTEQEIVNFHTALTTFNNSIGRVI